MNQPKLSFLFLFFIYKVINLKQRCKKKKNPSKNWEREREIAFCEGKLRKEWKKEWQIYNKRVWIRRDKIKEDEGKNV